jgi:ABC-2 type transport system permease protein
LGRILFTIRLDFFHWGVWKGIYKAGLIIPPDFSRRVPLKGRSEVGIMAIFLRTLTTGAFNLVMDRFLNVDESYLVTPLSQTDIVAGLIISELSVTTIIADLILTASVLLSGIGFSSSIGHLASIIVVIVLTTLSMLSLMFVILGRFSHPRIVGILIGFMNVILFFPSGASYPITSFPQ